MFQDNVAAVSNHGINMITSKTEIYNTTIEFSEGTADALDLQKVDCGFFSLFLGSHLDLGKSSTIKNLRALNSAVLCAFSQSELMVFDDVNFINNSVLSQSGRTISLQNTGDVSIKNAHFMDNH